MRVLKGKVLVTAPKKQESVTSLILEEEDIRSGEVYLSGSEQISKNESVMFGDEFEEIQMGGDHRAFLMDESNVKLIFSAGER